MMGEGAKEYMMLWHVRVCVRVSRVESEGGGGCATWLDHTHRSPSAVFSSTGMLDSTVRCSPLMLRCVCKRTHACEEARRCGMGARRSP